MEDKYQYEPSGMEIVITGIIGNTLAKPYYREIAARLGASACDKVLDYCSGNGGISREILKHSSNIDLTYSDVSEKWLIQAGKQLKCYENARGEKIESFQGRLAGGDYDRILVHFTLHDFPRQYRLQIINQLIDNLKPSGRLFIMEPLNSSHGIQLHELINLLEYTKKLSYEYRIEKRRFVGTYIEIEASRKVE